MEQLEVLSGRSLASVWRLAAVSDDGTIPLPGTLAMETGGGFVFLFHDQGGLTIAPPVPRAELRWPTEPWLSMTRDGAEEWLDLAELDDDEVLPPLPLTVRAIDTWTVKGAYLAGASISLSDGRTELVLVTTNDFDLRCVARSTALKYLDTLATVQSMPLHHTSSAGP